MSTPKCRCEGCWWPMRVISRLPDPLYRASMAALKRRLRVVESEPDEATARGEALERWFLDQEKCLGSVEPCRKATCAVCIYLGGSEPWPLDDERRA